MDGIMNIRIGLMPSEYNMLTGHANTYLVKDVYPSMTARQLIEKLAWRFRVNKDKWHLIVYSDDNPWYILDRNVEIGRFIGNKDERLYFYPAFVVCDR